MASSNIAMIDGLNRNPNIRTKLRIRENCNFVDFRGFLERRLEAKERRKWRAEIFTGKYSKYDIFPISIMFWQFY